VDVEVEPELCDWEELEETWGYRTTSSRIRSNNSSGNARRFIVFELAICFIVDSNMKVRT
jgi:hypothetical protein